MLASAIILGFLGSLHCVGMCGPIAFVLPLDRAQPVKKFFQLFTYHSGRLMSYGFLGLLFGLVGKGLFISGLQQKLSIITGVLMIVIILIPYRHLNKYNFSKPILKLLSVLKSSLVKRLKIKGMWSIRFIFYTRRKRAFHQWSSTIAILYSVNCKDSYYHDNL